ncbi:MAG: hypothetical protein ACRETJ_12895 [Steroidobacteraceae bacterium]
MSSIRYLAHMSCLISLVCLLAGCVIAPAHDGDYRDGHRGDYREGYYDAPHHRYWHDHRWHQCDRDDARCR